MATVRVRRTVRKAEAKAVTAAVRVTARALVRKVATAVRRATAAKADTVPKEVRAALKAATTPVVRSAVLRTAAATADRPNNTAAAKAASAADRKAVGAAVPAWAVRLTAVLPNPVTAAPPTAAATKVRCTADAVATRKVLTRAPVPAHAPATTLTKMSTRQSPVAKRGFGFLPSTKHITAVQQTNRSKPKTRLYHQPVAPL